MRRRTRISPRPGSSRPAGRHRRRSTPGRPATTISSKQPLAALLRARGIGVLPQARPTRSMRSKPTPCVRGRSGDHAGGRFIAARAEVALVRAPRQRVGDAALRRPLLMIVDRFPGSPTWCLASGMALVGNRWVCQDPGAGAADLPARGCVSASRPSRCRLGEAPAGEAPEPARPLAALPRILLRQLPVLGVHAVRRGAHLGAGGRRDHGGDSGGGGDPRASSSTSASRRAWPSASPARWAASRWCPSANMAGSAVPMRSDAAGSGNLLLLGAVSCEAIYVVLGKKLAANVSPKRISALINPLGPAAGDAAPGCVAGVRLRFRRRERRALVAAAVLFAGGQHGHGVAVDDRPEARAGLAGGRIHRDAAAGGGGRRRRGVPRRALLAGSGRCVRARAGGVVLATWPARRA